MRTMTWEGTEFGNFILIASIHLRDQSIENFMSSSPLGCDFVTSLLSNKHRCYVQINSVGKLNFK